MELEGEYAQREGGVEEWGPLFPDNTVSST